MAGDHRLPDMMERRDVRQFDRCCVGLRKIKKLAMSQSKGRRLQWELVDAFHHRHFMVRQRMFML